MPVGLRSASLRLRKPQDDERLGNNGNGNGKGPPATKGNPHSQLSPTPTPEDGSDSGSDEVLNTTPSTAETAPTSPTSPANAEAIQSTTSSTPVPSSADSQESINTEMTPGGTPSQRTSTTGDKASARIDESSSHFPTSGAPSSSPTPSNLPSSVPNPDPGPEISPGIAGALGVIVLLIIILLLLFIRSAARKRRRARAELPHAQDAFSNPGMGCIEGSLSAREVAVQPSTANEPANAFPTTFTDDHPDNRSSFDFRSGLTTIITWPTVRTSFTNRSGRTGDQLGAQSVAETGQIVSSAESRQAAGVVRGSSDADALSSHRATIESV